MGIDGRLERQPRGDGPYLGLSDEVYSGKNFRISKHTVLERIDLEEGMSDGEKIGSLEEYLGKMLLVEGPQEVFTSGVYRGKLAIGEYSYTDSYSIDGFSSKELRYSEMVAAFEIKTD